MYTLGFTNQFYTLWEVKEPQKKYTSGFVLNGVFTGSFYWVQECNYVQNLSTDYDKAVDKMKERFGDNFAIDLELRGQHSFVRQSDYTIYNDIPDYVFSFGKLEGQDIRICNDVWQLTRAMKEERGKRRRVHARRRLIELGELVFNPWWKEGDEKYLTSTHFKKISDKKEEAKLNGHFFEDGKRITVSIKYIDGIGWPTEYGYMWIQKYVTEDGRMLKYKGTSPLEISDSEFIEVVGTVAHVTYNDAPETHLKRMKIKNPVPNA